MGKGQGNPASETGEVMMDGHVEEQGFSKGRNAPASRQIDIGSDSNRNFYDIVCAVGGLGVLSLIFCILAPILAIGWIFLPLTHGMYTFTAFVILYTITQNLPKYYSRRYKDGPLHRPLINALETYVTDCKVFKECDLDPERNYIFAWHPHGRMFYGFGMLIGLFSKWFPEITGRGKDIFAGINDTMFRIPFVSNWLHLVGMIECNKRSVKGKLNQGQSVGLIIGGIEEVLEGTFDDKDVLFLKNRKGFCKLAIDHGSGVVPVFCFGENLLFQHESDATLGFWRWVNKFVKLGAPFPIRGWMGAPFPLRVPMLIAIGKPMFAEKGESVDDFHARYVEELVKLHAKYLGLSSDPKRKLVIV